MRISLLVVIALLLAACASAGSDAHVVKQTTWAQTPTVPDAMRQRVEDAALEFQQHAPVPRLALFDIAYPSSDAELMDMAGYGVLLLTTLSQSHDELPPKRLYVVIDGVEHPLTLITATKTATIQSPTVAKVLGANRWDGLYLFPVYLMRDNAALSIDFAANRSGFILGHFSNADQKTLNYTEFIDSAPTVDAPSSDAIMSLVTREFPGFIGRAP
jgi:hypothetical protein